MGTGRVRSARRGWFSTRALGMHAALAVLVPGCTVLCVWQVHRALSGNSLSWAYVFEWPFFAAYGTYMWWRLVHEQMTPRTAGRPEVETPSAEVADGDQELDAYNRYLAELNASGQQKRW